MAGNPTPHFTELHPPLAPDEARVQAARCLFCWDAPCTRACPTDIDVPRFIRQILHGNSLGAAETILDENALGGSCARVCPTEVLCEGACVTNLTQGAPVQIGLLQRFATDQAAEQGFQPFEPGPDSGKRVAVVGSGPSGLSCAFELRRRGHEVTLFEAREIPGGLNTLGIAAYKISTDFALEEVQRVREMGVEIRLGETVDAESLAGLLDDFDAVFLGIGLGATASLGLSGEERVWEGLDFVFQTHTKAFDECEVGRRVVVLGAGNTAIDCANAAVRLGAEKVTVAYRRTESEMPAYRHEAELARASGVYFEWLVAPEQLIFEEGELRAIRLRRQRMEGEGRGARLIAIEGSDVQIECDMVIKALGQKPLEGLVRSIPGLKTDRGRVLVDPETGATGVVGLFAGGDCANGGAEVVDAVQHGKVAARGICTYLEGK